MKRKKIVLADKYTCTGCMACVDSCPKNAISTYIGKDGHYYVHINKDECVQCGLCMITCPVISDFTYKNEVFKSKPYAAWNNDSNQRKNSASGGVFSALATKVLELGGIVIGVSIKNNVAYHKAIDSIDDLKELQGSKYQQSDASGIYSITKKYLNEDRLVLFSGTGCQVAGLLSYLGKRKYEKLLTCDLICAGVPSRLPLNKFLELSNNNVSIVKYRGKYHGWKDSYNLTVEKNNQKIINPEYSRMILNSFSAGITDRYSCMDCHFNGVSRKSDITIADFWGEVDFPEEHYDGVSLVIAHSSKGIDILNSSNITLKKSSWRKALPKNPRCVIGKVPFAKLRFERRFIGFFFDHLSDKNLFRLYANVNRTGPFWILYKIFVYLLWKVSCKMRGKKINRVITKLEVNEN